MEAAVAAAAKAAAEVTGAESVGGVGCQRQTVLGFNRHAEPSSTHTLGNTHGSCLALQSASTPMVQPAKCLASPPPNTLSPGSQLSHALLTIPPPPTTPPRPMQANSVNTRWWCHSQHTPRSRTQITHPAHTALTCTRPSSCVVPHQAQLRRGSGSPAGLMTSEGCQTHAEGVGGG